MLLRSITIKNLKLLRDVTIPFEIDGRPRRWTVFIGRNGAGKTSILQAIALAAAGNAGAQNIAATVREQLTDVRCSAEAKIEAEFRFDEIGQQHGSRPLASSPEDRPTGLRVDVSVPRGRDPLQSISWYTNRARPEGKTGTEDSDPLVAARANNLNHWFVAGYGVHRYAQPKQSGGQSPPWPSIDRLRPLFEPVPLIGPNFAGILVDQLVRDFAKLLRQIVTSTPDVLPGIKNLELRGQGGVKKAQDLTESNRFVERIGQNEQKFPATWLAHGHQSTLAWISDLVGQVLLEASTAVRPEEMEGIVLIDEIDLYLHPTWQVTFIEALRQTFPKLQFVATTHSPILLTGLRREEVFILERDETSGDVTWRHPMRDPRLLTGSELYEEFFEIRDLYPTHLARKLDAYRTLAMNPYRPETDEPKIDALAEELQTEGIELRPRVPRRGAQ